MFYNIITVAIMLFQPFLCYGMNATEPHKLFSRLEIIALSDELEEYFPPLEKRLLLPRDAYEKIKIMALQEQNSALRTKKNYLDQKSQDLEKEIIEQQQQQIDKQLLKKVEEQKQKKLAEKNAIEQQKINKKNTKKQAQQQYQLKIPTRHDHLHKLKQLYEKFNVKNREQLIPKLQELALNLASYSFLNNKKNGPYFDQDAMILCGSIDTYWSYTFFLKNYAIITQKESFSDAVLLIETLKKNNDL